jgi:hypothetical protein
MAEWRTCGCETCRAGGYTWSEDFKMKCLAASVSRMTNSERVDFFGRWANRHGEASSAKLAKFYWRLFPRRENAYSAAQGRVGGRGGREVDTQDRHPKRPVRVHRHRGDQGGRREGDPSHQLHQRLSPGREDPGE